VSAVPLINTGIDDSSNGAFVRYATTDIDVKKQIGESLDCNRKF
jgi:hypothetical protein